MRTLILALFASISCLAAAELPFKMAPEYSCDMTMSGGPHTGKGHMVLSKEGRRVEIAAPQGNMVMIMRKDEQVMHMLMVDMKMVMNMPLGKSAFVDPTADPKVSWEKKGSETIEGVACDTYEFKGEKSNGTIWIDPARGVMVRVKDAKGSQADFSNYKIGPQDAALFTVPADYKPFDPAAMGGAHGGQ